MATSTPKTTRTVVYKGHTIEIAATRSAKGIYVPFVVIDGTRRSIAAKGKTVDGALDEGERLAKALIDAGLPPVAKPKPTRP